MVGDAMTTQDEFEWIGCSIPQDDDEGRENALWEYRFAHATGDESLCSAILDDWIGCKRAGNLHSLALEPIPKEAVAVRKAFLIDMLRRFETRLAWLETVKTV
jgi:hypothetical protein